MEKGTREPVSLSSTSMYSDLSVTCRESVWLPSEVAGPASAIIGMVDAGAAAASGANRPTAAAGGADTDATNTGCEFRACIYTAPRFVVWFVAYTDNMVHVYTDTVSFATLIFML